MHVARGGVILFIIVANFVEKLSEYDKTSIVLLLENIVNWYIIQTVFKGGKTWNQNFMPRKVIFDFDSVTFMDSAGIGLLVGRYKFANLLGAKLEVANLTQSVNKIFEMSGILKLIPVAGKE